MTRPRARLVVRLLLLLAVVALAYVAVTGVQVWRASRQDDAASADAIVVLGAAQYDGRPSAVYRSRLDHAADLFERDLAPRVVVTGGRQPGDRFTEAASGEGYLISRGVPEEAVDLESGGSNSWSSLRAAARLLGDGDRVLLVSSPYHALRVEQIAAEVGLDPLFSPAPGSGVDGPQRVGRLAGETLAVSVGRLVGYGRLDRLGDRLR